MFRKFLISQSIMLSSLTVFIALVIDLNTPLGVAGGTLYVFPVLTGLLYINVRASFILASISSVLIVLGAINSPPEAHFHIYATNRLYALIVVWTIALLIVYLKKAFDERDQKSEFLEKTSKELKFLTQATHKHNLVSVTDLEGNIIFANDTFCSTTGYQEEELIGQNHKILKSGKHPVEFYKHLWETINKGDIFQAVMKNHKKDGDAFWARMTIIPYVDKNNKPYKFLAIRTDITDQILNINALKEAKQKAEFASKVKSDFISSMSHEFRTPLNAVIGFTELLKMQSSKNQVDDNSTEYLDYILEGGQYLLKLVNDILYLSAEEFNSESHTPEPTDIRQTTHSAINSLRHHAETKGIEFNLIMNDNVPEVIEMETNSLRKILNNIVGNSVKFTNKGGFVDIQIGAFDAEKLKIEIKDSGMGVPPEVLRRLGEPFLSGNPYKENKHDQSTGLGLYISKQLITKTGGHMDVESELNKGTIVTINIPLVSKYSHAK